MRKTLSLALVVLMLTALLAGCSSNDSGTVARVDSPAEPVTLTIAGPWPDFTALDPVADAFEKKYPDCTVVYEYIQNFNENMVKRLAADNAGIDLMLVNNIQSDSDILPYALDLSSAGDKLDLSNAYQSLVDNYKLQTTVAEDKGKFYAIALGAEVRGMFVNTTLLDSLGISVPTNRTEFLAACATLKEAGYIPVHGNPGAFGTTFLYPYICNIIANADDYDATYKLVNERSADAAELFRDPFEFLYTLVESRYYNYKYAETEMNMFADISNEGYARSFMNVVSDENGDYNKLDDVGQIAFMPFVQSLTSVIEKTKADYHSGIEYTFILSPVSDDGAYAYLSPARGIAVASASEHTDQAIDFLNFIFEPENNITFCSGMGFVANTKNAFQLIKQDFDIPESSISNVGQVTFDYNFYSIIEQTLVAISKCNNPKYMNVDADGNVSLYPFSYYMDSFVQSFTAEQ